MDNGHESSTESSEPGDSTRKVKSLRGPLKWEFLIALGILLVLFTVFQVGVSIWVDRKLHYRGQVEYDEWKAFLDAPQEFPAEIFRPVETSEALRTRIAEAQTVLGEVQRMIEDGSGLSWSDIFNAAIPFFAGERVLSAERWEQARRTAEDYEPYVAAAVEVAEQVQREFQRYGNFRLGDLRRNFRTLAALRLLGMKASILAQDGDVAGAVDCCLAALWLEAASPAGDIAHTLGLRKIFISFIHNTALDTLDPARLKRILAELNLLDRHTNWDVAEHAWVLELNYRIRMLGDRGINIERIPGKTGAEYMNDIVAGENPPLGFAGCISALAHDIVAGAKLKGRRVHPVYLEMIRALEVGDKIEEFYFFHSFWRFPSVLRDEEERALTALDNLRLDVAVRLHKMETAEYPAATSDLVPMWLPEPIVDRETGEPLKWNREGSWYAR